MSHLIDAQKLIATFKAHDGFMPGLVFGLLDYYFENGPFEFDAGKLSQWLSVSKFERMPPEVVSEFEDELERYFLPTAKGWIPRPGVLTVE